VILALVKQEQCLRRRRVKYIVGCIFGEPAWDILLDLYVAHFAQECLTLGDLSNLTGTAQTTVTRWVDVLIDRGLASRQPDDDDLRRTLVMISATGITSIEAIFKSP
jgi:DNA-binding MarR family transcriptional regulator